MDFAGISISAVSNQFNIIMQRSAGNGAIGQCAILRHVSNIFNGNILAFYLDYIRITISSCIQLAQVGYIT